MCFIFWDWLFLKVRKDIEHGKTKESSPYSHDIALKRSMTVPMILGGSAEIPNIQIPYCKTTDVVPTLLDLLGINPHKSVVGKSLIPWKYW